MFGLFGQGRRLAFTPGILPEDDRQKRVAMASMGGTGGSAPQMQMPKRSMADKIGIFGGMLADMDWTMPGGQAAAMRSDSDQRLNVARQEMERQRRVKLALEMAGGDTKLAAAAQIAPDAIAERTISNTMLNPLAVKADDRAERGLNEQIQSGEFSRNMATQRFQYGQQRDAIGDERYYDERDYTRGRDVMNDQFRDKQFDRGVYESDRGYGLQRDQFGLAQDNAAFNQSIAMQEMASAQGQQKPFSGAQSQVAGYAHKAEQAEANLQSHFQDGFDPLKGQGLGLKIGLRPDSRKKYDAIKGEFINAVLRKESGAAISNDEYERAERMYFPHPLDSPQVAEQKARARARAIQSMKAESQGAYDAMFGQPQQDTGDIRSMSTEDLMRIANQGF